MSERGYSHRGIDKCMTDPISGERQWLYQVLKADILCVFLFSPIVFQVRFSFSINRFNRLLLLTFSFLTLSSGVLLCFTVPWQKNFYVQQSLLNYHRNNIKKYCNIIPSPHPVTIKILYKSLFFNNHMKLLYPPTTSR